MSVPTPDHVVWAEVFVFGGFAAIGGLLAYLLRTMNDEHTPTIMRAIVEALSSGFVGLIAMLICKALGLDWKWSGVVVGVFGWLGAEASIMVAIRFLKSKLGLKNGD